VRYYRHGVISRSAVGARKREAFSRLDSFWLRFADSPLIYIKAREGGEQAELIFDKQWVLGRGRRRDEGKAQTLITLRREGGGWRITSERQLRLYYSATRTVKR
jgi:hypothetical protein